MARAIVFLIVIALSVAAALWWMFPGDPSTELRERWSPLSRVERAPAPDLGPGIERWRIFDAAGDTITALWKPASEEDARPWTAVLLGGLGTGARAALILPRDTAAQVLAVDWPWSGPTKMSRLEFLRLLPRIREALLRSPAAVALGIEAAAVQPDVDTSRIVLVGASLGTPPALAALRLTKRADALVLIDGFADLRATLGASMRSVIEPEFLVPALAALAARLVRPLEPSLHFGAAANIPAFLINAERDERVPRECVLQLREGIPRAEARWRSGGHLLPQRASMIGELSGDVRAWLDSLGAGNRRAPTLGAGNRQVPTRADLR